MTDVLGESPLEYYTQEQAKLYNLSGAFQRIQKKMTLEALKIGSFEIGSRVLDLGCGTGFSTKVLKDKGFKATGCDVNENMLYYAQEKGLKVVKCDMKDLPFKDEEFDHLISISTIQWAKPKDYERIIEEAARVIKHSAVIQFYPENEAEFKHFLSKTKKHFFAQVIKAGEGRKEKRYVMLKKRKRI